MAARLDRAKMKEFDPSTLTIDFSDLPSERLKELILYIARKCADDPRFGATKLNKILFYSDFLSYALHGEPITGVAYIKLPKGPAPKPLVPVREEMKEKGDIIIEQRERYGLPQQRIIALRAPDLSKFSAENISLVDDVIQILWGRSAKAVSDLTHGYRGWKIAADKEEIPYEAVFLSNEGPTDYDISRARELIRQHGWDV